MSINNKEDELITDLNAIYSRREKLREALERLKTPPQTTKSSVVPDSGINDRQQILDNSLDELD